MSADADLRSWLHSWAEERLDFRVIDERCCFPPDVILALGNRGLLGMLVPNRWGGLGLPVREAVSIFESLGTIDLCLATFVANHTLATLPIERFSVDRYRRAYLSDLATGRKLGAFALTEPGAGSNLALIASEAQESRPGAWTIHGTKNWIGSAGWSDVVTTFVKDFDSEGKPAVTAFLIPRESHGLRIGAEAMKLGLRGMVQNTVHLDGVQVSDEQLLGERFRGMDVAQSCMTLNRMFLAAISLGAMKRSLHLAREFSRQRQVSSGILFENRLIRHRFYTHLQRIATLEAILGLATAQVESDAVLAMEMACAAKMLAGEFLWECVDFAVQVFGARGYEEHNELARKLRDARAFRIFEGPTEALSAYLGSIVFSGSGRLLEFLSTECRDTGVMGILEDTRRKLDARSTSDGMTREIGYSRLGEMAALSLATCSAVINDDTRVFIVSEMRALTFKLERELSAQGVEETLQAEQSPDTKAPLEPADPYAGVLPHWNSWNATTKTHEDMAPIHVLFERAAAHNRDKVAIVCGGRELTYRELHSRVNRVAVELDAAGVRLGSIVGIALPRSADAVVGMLAVLKCGGAYLPLDPSLPKDRIAFMVAEANVSVIIADTDDYLGLTATCINIEQTQQLSTSTISPETRATALDLAYIIFTSGSTGHPKGAMLPHQGVVNWMLWMRDTFNVTESDSIMWKAVVGFDHSVWECFLPLIMGAKLVIAENGREADWEYLSGLIESERVTMMQFVPSVLGKFLQQTTSAQCRSLRHVMSGGEALSPSLVRRFYETIPQCSLCNAYGPTEASIGVTMYPCPRQIESDFVPIGKPIDNIKIHILNSEMRPVKMADVGELYIEGGLARGYVNRLELTAERFQKSPFSSHTIYKTGDLARWLPDGNLQFIGRVDNQVKIRGLRIELEELEAVLKRHPEIYEAAAAVVGEGERASLWCYFKVKRGTSLGKEQVRQFLESRLPSYMVPTRIVEVDAFPLIASGKIDRRSLIKLKDTGEMRIAMNAAPLRNARELIQDAWRRILGVSEIGDNDDFYELGGNSLLVMDLAVFLKKQFGMKVPADLRKLRTIAAILDSMKLDRGVGAA